MLPDTTHCPSAENAAKLDSEGRFIVDSHVPVWMFHNFTLLSLLLLATCLQLGEKATDMTLYLRGEELTQDATKTKEGKKK
jgi:hypothetical protein